ncbi:hypothetical protein StoSoilB20_01860 [Arthrobacter sp. StoSoilB20]|nr:hypothetical protein StoSoilB20_01860 [Arthrobacter sp. StoSoilB20]
MHTVAGYLVPVRVNTGGHRGPNRTGNGDVPGVNCHWEEETSAGDTVHSGSGRGQEGVVTDTVNSDDQDVGFSLHSQDGTWIRRRLIGGSAPVYRRLRQCL